MGKFVGIGLTIFFLGAMVMFLTGHIGLGDHFVTFFDTLAGGN